MLAPHPFAGQRHSEPGPQSLFAEHGVPQLQKKFWKLWSQPSTSWEVKQGVVVQDPGGHPASPFSTMLHLPGVHTLCANAGVWMLVTIGAAQAIAAPAPIRFNILRREMPSLITSGSSGVIRFTSFERSSKTAQCGRIVRGAASSMRGKFRWARQPSYLRSAAGRP